MAGMSGLAGNVTITNTIDTTTLIGAVVKSWSANFSRNMVDTTGFTNAARNRAIGVVDITGSVSGSCDASVNMSPLQAFTKGTTPETLTLIAESGHTIQFPAIFDSFNVGVAVDGEATYSANFQIAAANTAFATTSTDTSVQTSYAVLVTWADPP